MVVQSLDGDLRRGGPLLGESPGEPPREVGRMAGTMGKGRSENERSRGAGEGGGVGKEAAGGGSSAAAPSQAHLKQRPPPAHPLGSSPPGLPNADLMKDGIMNHFLLLPSCCQELL